MYISWQNTHWIEQKSKIYFPTFLVHFFHSSTKIISSFFLKSFHNTKTLWHNSKRIEIGVGKTQMIRPNSLILQMNYIIYSWSHGQLVSHKKRTNPQPLFSSHLYSIHHQIQDELTKKLIPAYYIFHQFKII